MPSSLTWNKIMVTCRFRLHVCGKLFHESFCHMREGSMFCIMNCSTQVQPTICSEAHNYSYRCLMHGLVEQCCIVESQFCGLQSPHSRLLSIIPPSIIVKLMETQVLFFNSQIECISCWYCAKVSVLYHCTIACRVVGLHSLLF